MRDFNADGILVGKPYQAVNEQSLTQKYPIGMIFEAFGKRYRYCRAAAALTPGKRGCVNLATPPWEGANATYGLGSDDTTATGKDGDNFVDIIGGHDHVHTIDEFQDGNIVIFPVAGIEIFQHRIIGNDYGATHHMRLYIDPPLHEDCALVPCDISPSRYMNVGAPASVGTQFSVIVIPEILVTGDGYYFWGQTKGECWVTPNAPITAASTRLVGFHTNGTIIAFTGAIQFAGILIASNAAGDDANITLMLE